MTDTTTTTTDRRRTSLVAALALASLGTGLGYALAQGLMTARSAVEPTLLPTQLHALWLGLVLTIAVLAAVGR